MATDRDKDKQSTVNWVPAVFRGYLGLEDTYTKPQYSGYGNRAEMAGSTTNWIPSFARRWFGLEYAEPKRYGPSSDEYSAPVSRPALPSPREVAAPVMYRAALATPAGTPSYRGGSVDYRAPRPEGSYRMATEDQGPAGGPAGGSAGGSAASDTGKESGSWRSSGTSMESWKSDNTSWRSSGSDTGSGPVMPSVEGQPPRFEGYVQPITYGVRAYVRGALPPQGLEEFTRQLRTTVNDVSDLYGKSIRFQVEDVVRFFEDMRKRITVQRSGANRVTSVKPEVATEPPKATRVAAKVDVATTEAAKKSTE